MLLDDDSPKVMLFADEQLAHTERMSNSIRACNAVYVEGQSQLCYVIPEDNS